MIEWEASGRWETCRAIAPAIACCYRCRCIAACCSWCPLFEAEAARLRLTGKRWVQDPNTAALLPSLKAQEWGNPAEKEYYDYMKSYR